jgi:diguanylate cyclase (GGDEF)-like protein/PAS domain S-box-containing protein
MNNPTTLRTLIVEDNAVDAELVIDQLQEAGYRLDWTRVDTEAAYLSALDTGPDVILSDYTLPGFGGLQALALLKQRNLDIPFILVSGTIGESLAVAVMVAGAHDYVLKDNLARLAPVIERELRACALRHERHAALAQLARQTRDLGERVKELTCLYAVSALAQQSDLPLEELLEKTMTHLVSAYQWPELTGVRIVHESTTRQTPGFRLTDWRQEAALVLDGSTIGSITVCYLEAPPAPAGDPFLAEECQMLDAVAQRISDHIADRRLRSALSESEGRFRATFDSAPIGIMHSSLDSRILHVNPKLCEILGFTREELLTMTLADIIPPDWRGMEQAKFLEPMLSGEIETYRSERPFLRKNGSIAWVNRHVSLVRDAAGRPLYFLRTIEDISERKSIADQLVRERQLLRTVIDAIPDRIFVKDHEGRFLLQNTANLKVRGLERHDDIVGKTVFDFYPRALAEQRTAEDRAVIESGLPLLNREGQTHFGDATKGEHGTRWHLTSKIPLRDAAGRIYGVAGINHDITEAKISELKLQESERFAKSTIDALSKHLCVLDEAGTIITVNKAWRDFSAANGRLAGQGLAEGANYLEVCDNATGDSRVQGREFGAGIRAVLQGKLANFTLEYACHSPGEQRWFLGKVAPFHGSGQRRVVVTHEDITPRKQAEMNLRSAQEKLETAIKSTNVGLWDWNLKTNDIQYSAEWKSQLGYSVSEIEDTVDAARNLMHPEDIDKTFERVNQCLSDATLDFAVEFRMRHKDGSYRWLLSRGRVHRDKHCKPDRFVGGHLDITERKLAEQQIRRLNQFYSALSQTNAAIVRISDRDELFSRICKIAVNHNQFALAWIGLAEAHGGMIRIVASAGDAAKYLDGLRISTDAGIPEGQGISSHAIRKGCTVVCNDIGNDASLAPWHEQTRAAGLRSVASLPLRTADRVIGVLTLMAGETGFFDSTLVSLLEEMAEDISFALNGIDLEAKHRQAQLALQDSDEKFRQLTRNIPQVFWMTDAAQRNTIYVSPTYEKITGRPASELEARPHAWLQTVHAEDRERVKYARRERAPLGTYDIEYRILQADGSLRWIHDRAFPVQNAQGEVYRVAGIAEDITARKQTEEQLANLAHYDSLTGLPNRVLFNDRLQQALALARRNQWTLGVLFLDLDRFKMINDTLGHLKGDLLLKQVATRLSACLRPTDTVGRLSGDEFAIILSELAEAQNAGYVAQKIKNALAAPFDLDGNEVFVTASIGVTLYPSDSEDAETLIRDADAAMYGAKAAGRNNYLYYTAEMNARATEKLRIETGIRRGLERGELLLHYQPKIDIASGRISGLEALLRWQSPEHGLVPPGQFIPVLEETGLIVQVGEWVLHAACAQLKAWQRAGVNLVPVAINLSARQLRQQGFAAALELALKDHGIDPELIHMEITESSLMENPEEAIAILKELKTLGIHLEADDFGTGYSSLSYLKRFPLDALKIDRSFVRDMTVDEDDAVIARTVITLAHSLGLKVIAEGVETEEQLAFLGDNCCDEAQGFLFAWPLPAEECAALLSSNGPLHSPRRQPEAAGRKPAILLVDDDPNDRTLAQIMLRKDGHDVLTAADARQAFELLNNNPVGIVISDQNMPKMSGVEFLRQVKLMYPATVRIMFSGESDFDTATAAINEGEVQRFFVKGRDEELLRREIKRKSGLPGGPLRRRAG